MEKNFNVEKNIKIKANFDTFSDFSVNIVNLPPDYNVDYFVGQRITGSKISEGVYKSGINTFNIPKPFFFVSVGKIYNNVIGNDKAPGIIDAINMKLMTKNDINDLSLDSEDFKTFASRFNTEEYEFYRFNDDDQSNLRNLIIEFYYILTFETSLGGSIKVIQDEEEIIVPQNSIQNVRSVYGKNIQLIAIPSEGYSFIGWDNEITKVENNEITKAFFVKTSDETKTFWQKYRLYIIIAIILLLLIILITITIIVLRNKKK